MTVEELQIILSCDTEQAEKALNQLETQVAKVMKRIAPSLERTGRDVTKLMADIAKHEAAIEASAAKVTQARAKAQEATNRLRNSAAAAALKELKLEQALTKEKEKQKQALKDAAWLAKQPATTFDTGQSVPPASVAQGRIGNAVDLNAWKAQAKEIENFISKLDPAIKAQKQAEQQIKASAENVRKALQQAFGGYNYENNGAMEQLAQKIILVRRELDALNTKYSETVERFGEHSIQAIGLEKSIMRANQELEKFQAKAQESVNALGNQSGGMSSIFNDAMGEFAAAKANPYVLAAQEIIKQLKKVDDWAKRVLKRTFDSITNSAKKMGNAIQGAVKKILPDFSRFSNMIKQMVSRMLLRKVINGFFNAIKEGLQNAARGSEKVNAILSQLMSSFTYVKNSITAAFIPALEAIAPVAIRIADSLAVLMNKVAELTAVLLGKTSFTKAKKIQQDYANSLDGTASAATKATKALAGFDKLNILGSKAASGSSAVDYSDMFEEVEVSPLQRLLDIDVTGWVSKLNKALASINWTSIQQGAKNAAHWLAGMLNDITAALDWSGVGNAIAQGVNTVFTFIYEYLTTYNWSALGKGIGDSLNALIKGINWALVGKTLASSLSALVDVIYEFFVTFDWVSFGKSIGDAIMAWFSEIDWAKAGKTISEGVKGLLRLLRSAIEQVDWVQVGRDLAEFLKSLDWIGIINELSPAISAAFNALQEVISGLLEENFPEISAWLKNNEGTFEKVATTVLGIATAIGLISTAITILIPTIMFLLSPIGSIITTVALLGAGILLLRDKWNELKNMAVEACEKMKSSSSSARDKWNDAWVGFGAWIKENIGKPVEDFFVGVGRWAQKAWDDITSIWGKLENWFKTNISDPITKLFDGLKAKVSGFGDTIKGFFTGSGFSSTLSIGASAVPAFADGGLAYSSTLAIVGDNKNASADPEVIAPLSKLKEYMGSNQKLERQNDEMIRWLKTIAAKNTTVQIGASKELGRVTRLSQEMDAAAMGLG